MSSLDVSLRLRLINALKGPAREAKGDLAGVGAAARKLNGTGGGDKLARDLKKISGEADRANASVKRLDQSSRALGRGAGAGAAGGAFGRSSGVASAAVGARLGRVAAAGTEVGSALGAGGAALGVTAATGVATGGIIAAGLAIKGAIREAMQFEDAMAEVRKAVDMPQDEFAALEREILKISRATPLAKEEIAQLVAQAGFAGRPTEDLVRFGTFAAKAAVAFGMTAEQAGQSLAELGTVFGLTQDRIEAIGDAINVLGDNTASREADIVKFLTKVGAAAKTFGLAERETAAFGAAMLSMGTAPEVAATGFNALISKLQTASKQGKNFQVGLKSLGLSSKQVEQLIRKGPVDAILGVLDRVAKLPDDKRMGALLDLFGLEYADDAARLAGSIDQVRRALQLVKDEVGNKGSVEKAFKIFDDLTSSKLEKLGNQFAVLGTRIGKAITPAIGAMADGLASVLEKINTTLDRAADVKALSDKLTGGQSLSPEDKDKLKQDPELNRQFQGAIAAKDHPVIGMVQQLIELEKELASVQAAADKGDLGAQNKMLALQAVINTLKSELESAMKMPGAAEAVAQSMRAVAAAVASEGEAAVQAAQQIAERMKAMFNFTVSPTIAPQFAPSGGNAAPPASAPLPPRKPKMSATGGGQRVAVNQTIHVHGVQDAGALHRELARAEGRAVREARNRALFDTGGALA